MIYSEKKLVCSYKSVEQRILINGNCTNDIDNTNHDDVVRIMVMIPAVFVTMTLFSLNYKNNSDTVRHDTQASPPPG